MKPAACRPSGLPSPEINSSRQAPVAPRFQSRPVEAAGPSSPQAGTGGGSLPAGKSVRIAPPWFESLMSSPPVPFQPLPDKDLKGRLQDPAKSVTFYQKQVEGRRQAKETGAVYTFAPFMTTLANMRDLTQHILANRQFAQPLTEIDSAAFQVLAGRIEQLLERQAPYESTVQLAVMMTCMLEVATARYALPALQDTAPQLFVHAPFHQRLRSFTFMARTMDGPSRNLHSRDIPLSLILDCAFGQPGPGQPDVRQQLFHHSLLAKICDADWLQNDCLFLYPSFEPLDPQDFCRLGHLPVYPLGMMSAYALNADGYMQTPLKFLAHDFGHASHNATWKHLIGAMPLESLHSRLQFRQLVMDQLPTTLIAGQIEAAVSLVVFHLFHEVTAYIARQQLQPCSFVPLLNEINEIRREGGSGYPAEYRHIDDWQALLACLWVHRAYRFWCHQGGESQAQAAAALGDQFIQEALPALRTCWTFLHRHYAGLKAYFLERARADALSPLMPDGPCLYKSRSDYALHYECGQLKVLEKYNSHAEGPVENIDVVFLDALHSPEERQQLKKRLNDVLPSGI